MNSFSLGSLRFLFPFSLSCVHFFFSRIFLLLSFLSVAWYGFQCHFCASLLHYSIHFMHGPFDPSLSSLSRLTTGLFYRSYGFLPSSLRRSPSFSLRMALFLCVYSVLQATCDMSMEFSTSILPISRATNVFSLFFFFLCSQFSFVPFSHPLFVLSVSRSSVSPDYTCCAATYMQDCPAFCGSCAVGTINRRTLLDLGSAQAGF